MSQEDSASSNPYAPPRDSSEEIPEVDAPTGGALERFSALVFAVLFTCLAGYLSWRFTGEPMKGRAVWILNYGLPVVCGIIAIAAFEGFMSRTRISRSAIVRGWLLHRAVVLNDVACVEQILRAPGGGYLIRLQLKNGKTKTIPGNGPELLASFQAVADHCRSDRYDTVTEVSPSADFELRVAGRLNVQEFYTAWHLHRGADPGNLYVATGVIAAIFCIAMAVLYAMGTRPRNIILLCVVAVPAVAFFLFRAVQNTRIKQEHQDSWEKEEGIYSPQTIRIRRDGIDFSFGEDGQQLEWGQFDRFKASGAFVLLYPGDEYFVVPRSFFDSAADWDTFCTLVAQNVRKDTGHGFLTDNRTLRADA